MLKVAILGYGKQGKKHREAWGKHGVVPEIFAKNMRDSVRDIRDLNPRDYHIIIVAISPIEEQTQVIESILKTGYQNYLIIEKPITYSAALLERLTRRQRTIYFIDEIYLQPILHRQPDIIYTTCPLYSSEYAIIEHAIGRFLSHPVGKINFSEIKFTHNVSQNLGYRIVYQDRGDEYKQEMKSIDFSQVYIGLLQSLSDNSLHENIRNNYLSFRRLPQFLFNLL